MKSKILRMFVLIVIALLPVFALGLVNSNKAYAFSSSGQCNLPASGSGQSSRCPVSTFWNYGGAIGLVNCQAAYNIVSIAGTPYYYTQIIPGFFAYTGGSSPMCGTSGTAHPVTGSYGAYCAEYKIINGTSYCSTINMWTNLNLSNGQSIYPRIYGNDSGYYYQYQ